MTSPLERAARALWIASGKRGELWDAPPTALWRIEMDRERPIYLDQARAVLEAIREPSEHMSSVGCHEYQQAEIGVVDELTQVHTWQAMIDAALSEKPE